MLIEIVTKHIKKVALQTTRDAVEKDILNEQKRIQEIEEKAQKEFNDVEILKVPSLPRLIHKTLGVLDEQLSEETQELQKVQKKYVLALESLEILESEKGRLNLEISRFKGVDKKLASLGRKKVPKDSDEQTNLAYKIARIHSKGYRFQEAIKLGEHAQQDLTELNESLDALNQLNWPSQSTYDPSLKTQYDLLYRSVFSLKQFDEKLKKKHPLIAKLKDQTYHSTPIRNFLLLISRHESVQYEKTEAFKTVKTHLDIVEKQIKALMAAQQEELRAKSNLIEEWNASILSFE